MNQQSPKIPYIITAPGSDEALNMGCTCPVLDNGHGEGFVLDGQKSWWISDDCPLHGIKHD